MGCFLLIIITVCCFYIHPALGVIAICVGLLAAAAR